MDLVKAALAILLGLALIVGSVEIGFRIYEHYNPKYEQVRRTTYEQSRAFREGTVRDLENLAREYAAGNDAVKASIRATALHRLADVPEDLLTPALIKFKRDLEDIK